MALKGGLRIILECSKEDYGLEIIKSIGVGWRYKAVIPLLLCKIGRTSVDNNNRICLLLVSRKLGSCPYKLAGPMRLRDLVDRLGRTFICEFLNLY